VAIITLSSKKHLGYILISSLKRVAIITLSSKKHLGYTLISSLKRVAIITLSSKKHLGYTLISSLKRVAIITLSSKNHLGLRKHWANESQHWYLVLTSRLLINHPLETCYDFVVDEAQLSYQGFILVTYPVDLSTSTLGNYKCCLVLCLGVCENRRFQFSGIWTTGSKFWLFRSTNLELAIDLQTGPKPRP
jgi:hypothetical protein